MSFPRKRESRLVPQQKPLDTLHQKRILIEDIVVDNPREESMNDRSDTDGDGYSSDTKTEAELAPKPCEESLSQTLMKATGNVNTRIVAIICATLIVVGLLFWPTLYRYDKTTMKGNTYPVRTNRLTGHTEYYLAGEWLSGGAKERSTQAEILPVEEQAKVTGNANLSGYGSFSGKIYNGSNWTITEIKIRVAAKGENGVVKWNREFMTTTTIGPLTTEDFSFNVTGDENVSIALTEWGIVEVHGYKKK
jgi:hypothetical protein